MSSFSAALGDLAWLNLIGLSKLDNTVIEGGYIKTTLLNATYIRSSIINTSYIEGLTLNFAQGTIGNWRIGGDLLYSGLLSSNNIYAAASVGVFLKSNYNSSTPASSTPAIVIKGTNVENTLVRLYINNSSNWGIQGLVGNVTYFHLGSYNRIAGWNFTDTTLSSQTLVGGAPVMELNSYSRELTIRSSSTKYVRMFYSSASVFGLEHYDNGTRLFQLGSTNQIAGWQLYNNYIVSSNGTLRMHQTDGFIIYGATTTPSTHGTALVNSRIRMYYSASNNWGLKGYNSSGVAVFELGSTNKIAGWTFDQYTMWAGSKWTTSVSTGGVSIGTSSDDRHFRAFLNSQNYVEMKYGSSSNWGLKGVSAGAAIFQLGNVNKIAGFTFDANSLIGSTIKISPNSLLFYSGAVNISEFVFSAGSGWSDTAWRTTGTSVYKAQIMLSKNAHDEGRIQITAGNILIAADYLLQMYLPVGAGSLPKNSLYRDSNGYVRIV